MNPHWHTNYIPDLLGPSHFLLFESGLWPLCPVPTLLFSTMTFGQLASVRAPECDPGLDSILQDAQVLSLASHDTEYGYSKTTEPCVIFVRSHKGTHCQHDLSLLVSLGQSSVNPFLSCSYPGPSFFLLEESGLANYTCEPWVPFQILNYPAFSPLLWRFSSWGYNQVFVILTQPILGVGGAFTNNLAAHTAISNNLELTSLGPKCSHW